MKFGKKYINRESRKSRCEFYYFFSFSFLHLLVLLFIILKMNVFVLCEWDEHVFLSFVKKKCVKNRCLDYGKMIYCVKVEHVCRSIAKADLTKL